MMADVASVVMALRDKPSRIDWLAAGTRAVPLGVKFRAHVSQGLKDSPWSVFRGEQWRYVPDALEGPGREVVEWLDDGEGTIAAGPAVLTKRYRQSLAALQRAVWEDLGSPQLTFDGLKLRARPEQENIELTGQFGKLRDRLESSASTPAAPARKQTVKLA